MRQWLGGGEIWRSLSSTAVAMPAAAAAATTDGGDGATVRPVEAGLSFSTLTLARHQRHEHGRRPWS